MSENKVKLDNSKSRFGKKAEEQKKSEADFEGKILDYQEQQKVTAEKLANLTSSVMQIIKDSTLKENKGPIQIEMESQICRDLTDLSLELNQDPAQPEGIGSAGMTLLLLKIVMFQRDQLNECRYKISKLEKSSSLPNHGQ